MRYRYATPAQVEKKINDGVAPCQRAERTTVGAALRGRPCVDYSVGR